MDDNAKPKAIERFSGPLCCEYFLVIVRTFPIGGSRSREAALYWALGVLFDGRHEVLGAWHDLVSDKTAWQDVSEDLKVRGVEKIRFVAGIDPTRIEAAMRTSYPSATVLPTIGQFVRQIEADLTARDREAARQLLDALCGAGTANAARNALTDLASSPVGAKSPRSLSAGAPT